MCADAPDTSGMNAAALLSAQTADKALAWFTQEYANTADARTETRDLANEVTRSQIGAMNTSTDLAKEYADYNRDTFRPLERRLVDEAQNYDTAERRDTAAGQAVADVNMAVAAQRQATMRDLARSGVSPESMKSQALNASGDINAAKAQAGAAYRARKDVESTGYARMADAANMGRGLPSAQTTALQTGIGAGNAAVGASTAGLNAANSGANMMGQGFKTALQGYGQSGNIYGNIASVQNQSRGQDFGFLSNIFGSVMSDPDVKKNRKPVSPRASMASLRKTPIEEWQYDPDKGGPEDGGTVRTGPMADKAHEEMGDEVAPGGEMLNVASMLGVVTNAVKDIDKRLARIEQRKAA